VRIGELHASVAAADTVHFVSRLRAENELPLQALRDDGASGN
jgi:hypothetical protein